MDFDQKNLTKIYNKKKIILSVGRWTPLGHSKKQFEMAQMFHKLTKNKKFQDWTLVLVGSLNEERSIEVEYYNKVKSYLESNKLNFELHYNLERDKLLQLYSKASIYWHFTGFNEDLENKPELTEHFGMTIVEAIMHGCVPYLYKAGGQVEILDILKLDNHFNSFNELEKKMLNTLNKKIKINKNFVKKFIN